MFLSIIYIFFGAILCTATVQYNETYQIYDFKAEKDQALVDNNEKIYSNCAEATAYSQTSGVYQIYIPQYIEHPFRVACDAKTQGGVWTIILNRMDGSVNFYRKWNTYKKGFGDLDGEFFLGLDKIYALTGDYSQELLVILEDFQGKEVFERYEKFAISGEDEEYALNTLGKASGTAGDSLSYNYRQKFATFDRDNANNCAKNRSGAWWYNNCSAANLAGTYNGTDRNCIYWNTFHNVESLKRATMMIRPRKS
ncbi:angiopoietin-related protein 2-like [Drosophila sulfurigaster albostrigata]|uniref:angiopoietin-related protein 2-like n=1 Tax=Drosophila sulfurigaster albostrigata TaxID=89887 RepID=UPI002D21DAEC|nr:angiopoietin-related protein 2-like [Drosophila sulfurigaster albostrigata]